jgi:hypothetical protein
MQPKIQKRIQEQQPRQKEPEIELKEYQPEQINIQAFDEIMVGYMKNMQEQNNLYAGLRTQEEQIRMNLNNLKKAIHDLKRMRNEELRTILRPYITGLKQLTPEDRNEFIKNNIMMYTGFDNQFKSVQAQRLHRGDELGEARMLVLKRLFFTIMYEHHIDPDELCDIIKPDVENPKNIRKKTELPTIEA